MLGPYTNDTQILILKTMKCQHNKRAAKKKKPREQTDILMCVDSDVGWR